MSRAARHIESVEDAEYLARRALPRVLYEYYKGGTGAGVTRDANPRAFADVSFRRRAATFVTSIDTRTCVVGRQISMPVLAAPTGGIRLCRPDAELAVARAVGAAGIIQVVSTMCGHPIEDIVAASSSPVFFQLYYPGSRERAGELIARAREAGCEALVLTVDTARGPRPERPYRHRLTFGRLTLRSALRMAPGALGHPAWLVRFLRDRDAFRTPMILDENQRPVDMWTAGASLRTQIPVWDDIPWIRQQWNAPLILKGILTTEDARRAVDVGAEAIVVSNHGGNHLDGSPPSIDVLPEIVEAVGGKIEILLDSGVRRGADVVRAVSLGATAVLIGRACIWGLAADGETGIGRILELFQDDIETTLAELGCPSIAALDPTYVRLDWRRSRGTRHSD